MQPFKPWVRESRLERVLCLGPWWLLGFLKATEAAIVAIVGVSNFLHNVVNELA